MKIAFFTPRSVAPLHPRLVILNEYFRKKGLSPTFINKSDHQNSVWVRINWISFWYFDLYAIYRCKALLRHYDLVVITDLRYLPLARFARKLNKHVIYETIDHNVYLRFYQLQRRMKFMNILKPLFISFFSKAEKYYALKYCDEIIVNSDSLKTYFNNHAHTIYYYSPFEKLKTENQHTNPTALLYLGAFSYDKGAEDILEIQKRLKLPLFIYGKLADRGLEKSVSDAPDVVYTPNLPVDELERQLSNLFEKYFLMGFSLIASVHYSYEVQEANKDIDYLALGIPLVGNYRQTTREKIEAGCGIFIDDKFLADKITDPAIKYSMKERCKNYYNKKYASSLFTKKLDGVFEKYIRRSER